MGRQLAIIATALGFSPACMAWQSSALLINSHAATPLPHRATLGVQRQRYQSHVGVATHTAVSCFGATEQYLERLALKPALVYSNSKESALVKIEPLKEAVKAEEAFKAVLRKVDPRVSGSLLKILSLAMLPLVVVACEGRVLGLDWRPFVAGGLSSAFAHGIATPLDVVKTRMQTNPEMYDGSIAKAYRRIVRKEGQMFLWQGLGPTVVGYFFEGALKIGVYELLKHAPFLTGQGTFFGASIFRSSELARFVFAGSVSGLVASIVLCPVEDARIRMVAEPGFLVRAKPFTTSEGDYEDDEEHDLWCEVNQLQATLELLKNEGVAGAYSGFGPMLLKQVPYTVAKIGCFDMFTAFCARRILSVAGRGAAATAVTAAAVRAPKHSLAVTLGCAVLASVLSSLASQPGDVLLTAAYKDDKHNIKKSRRKEGSGPRGGGYDGARGEGYGGDEAGEGEKKGERIRSSGVRGIGRQSAARLKSGVSSLSKLFVGTKARLIHVGFMNTLQLFSYDLLRVGLGMVRH